jgi:hypothetical protein
MKFSPFSSPESWPKICHSRADKSTGFTTGCDGPAAEGKTELKSNTINDSED